MEKNNGKILENGRRNEDQFSLKLNGFLEKLVPDYS